MFPNNEVFIYDTAVVNLGHFYSLPVKYIGAPLFLAFHRHNTVSRRTAISIMNGASAIA
jgi:hypothetical protein